MISINEEDRGKLISLYETHQRYHTELNNILGVLDAADEERRAAVESIKSLDKDDPQFTKLLLDLDESMDNILCVLKDAWAEHKNLVLVIQQTEAETKQFMDELADKYGEEIKDINILNSIINGK